MTAVLAAAAVMAAAFVKGSIGFGFPVLGTPLLSLVLDVKAAVVILIVPNIVMDGLQFIRNGAPVATVRRFAVLLMFGAVGMVVGTRLLVAVSSRTAALVLGAFALGLKVQDRLEQRTFNRALLGFLGLLGLWLVARNL